MAEQLPTLREVEQQVIQIHEDTPAEQVAHVVERIDHMKRVLKDVDKVLKDALLDWLKVNGELQVGPVRYYVGQKKKVKARNPEQVLEALLTVTGGDFGQVCECLSANAFKYGQARAVLGDAEFARVFETIVEREAKTGAPKREVKQVDERFSR